MSSYTTGEPPKHSWRFTVFIVILSLTAAALLARYGYLMLGGGEGGGNRAPARPAERGPILDRNGRVLALYARLANVTAWRSSIRDIGELAEDLAPILELEAGYIRDRIDYSPTDFVYLKKQIDESTIKLVEEAQAEGKLRGVGLEYIPGRIYPERNLASQIIGFVGDENRGLEGIEYAYEKDLASPGNGERGGQVVLTIDSNVQYILERLAGETMGETGAEAVLFMAMDPRTGEILGSASLPNYDPNDIRATTENQRINRPAVWAYEPGSVFKIFSLAAFLDSGVMTGDTTFLCNGYYEHVTNRGERILINCLGAHGRVRPRDIIVVSCNAGAAYASDLTEEEPFYQGLRAFGFGSRTQSGMPGETAGFLRGPERWSGRSKPTIAMGQEISVSALQVLQAASAIANDGVMVSPRVVSRIVSPDGITSRPWDSGPSRQVIKPETARLIRSAMVDVTSNIGTGWRANVEDLSLAVKTGTAQIIDPETLAYSGSDFIASCIALLPAESPSLILYLVIVKPRGEILGGRIAAPAIRQAAESLVDYLGIPRGRNPQISHPSRVILPGDQIPVVEDTVPDFSGFSKRSLMPLFLREDLHIEFEGEGWVRRQSPPPGEPITPETVIYLEFE
ncbi:MAG: transpeptidase family protein [Treponema sp.]|jgi:cell division protein FtsI (penicillin-binding protein 3)|nr:transpeptidase family protein [Treponema sp.]